MNPALLETLTGPKVLGELVIGRNIPQEQIPEEVDFKVVMGSNVSQEPGTKNLMYALGDPVKEGKYKFPVPATIVGKGWDAIGEGIETLRKGVSGTKLVVTV